MVEMAGLQPAASPARGERSRQLSYISMVPDFGVEPNRHGLWGRRTAVMLIWGDVANWVPDERIELPMRAARLLYRQRPRHEVSGMVFADASEMPTNGH